MCLAPAQISFSTSRFLFRKLRPAFALPQLGRVARSDARARAQVRLLRAAVTADAFRTEQGHWPSAAELAAALGSGSGLVVEVHDDVATLVDPTVPRGELAVSVRPDRPAARR